MRTIVKGPTEEVIEGFDWKDRLYAEDTLSASSWSVGSGLTGSNATHDDYRTQIELTGGTDKTQYLVTNTVTTTDGEVFVRSFYVMVRVR